jgi:hypothetical protein
VNLFGLRDLFGWLTGRSTKDRAPAKRATAKPTGKAKPFAGRLAQVARKNDDDEATVIDNSEELTVRDPRSEVDADRVPGGFRYNPNLMAAISVGPTADQLAELAAEISRHVARGSQEFQSHALPWLSVGVSRAGASVTASLRGPTPKATQAVAAHASQLEAALLACGVKGLTLDFGPPSAP